MNSKIPLYDSFANKKTIASSTDLNNLMDPGVYICASSTVASSLAHCPYTTSGFSLIVFGGSGNLQQLLVAGNVMYTRRASTSGFFHWFSYAGTDTGS